MRKHVTKTQGINLFEPNKENLHTGSHTDIHFEIS